MRFAIRPLAATALSVLAACGSITDPTGPSAFPSEPSLAKGGKPKPTPPPPTPLTPILFVHGWNSSGSIWSTMIGRFKTDGWTSAQLHSFSYNTAVSNATTAAIIQKKVDSITTATGASKVAIVSHSMGSMSARYYVRNLGGTGKVSAFVSLAGANHGTNTASTCVWLFRQTSCVEMMPGSTFLTELNSGDETPDGPGYRTWWSPCDQVINPQSSTLLAGATNTQTACLQHSDLYSDAFVYGEVRDFVKQPGVSLFVASLQ